MFVQQLTRNAYLDPHSAMFCTLTSLGQLRYMNMNDVIATPKEKIKRWFTHNTYVHEDASIVNYLVREAKTRSSAGLINTWQNYGSTRVEHSLGGEQLAHDKVQVKTNAEYLPINKDVKSSVQRSRLEYSPLDCGNTHKNFVKAQYQNLKMLGLFSEHVSILCYDVTDIQPLDVVVYRQANADPKTPVSNSDVYVVIGKTVMVKSATYVERLELVRHNIVEKGATELATIDGASTAVADSVIPNSIIDPTSNIGADTLPIAQSLHEITKVTEGSLSELKSSVPDMRKAGGFLKPTLKGLHDTLKTIERVKNAPQMAVAQLKGSLNSMKHFATMGKSYVNQMKNSVNNIRNMKEALKPKNLTAAVRSTLMFKKGGSLNAITYNLGVIRQGIQIERMLGPINYQLTSNYDRLKSIAGGDRVIADFRNYSNQIMSNTQAMRRETNHLWNESVSILHAAPIPLPTNMLASNSNRMSGVMGNLYRAPASRSTVAVPLDIATQDVGNSMMRRAEDRQPPWINPESSWDYSAEIAKARSANAGYDDSADSFENAYKALEDDDEAAQMRDNDATT
jgi:hypothetical protein